MICPNCFGNNAQVAYSPISGSLVCLGDHCTWERRLNEDEVFELFFGAGPGAVAPVADLVSEMA